MSSKQNLVTYLCPTKGSAAGLPIRTLSFFVHRDDEGQLRIRTGRVCSWPGSHGNGFEVDNIQKTVIWSDTELRLADSADDAYEIPFKVSDPCLIKVEEIDFLKKGKNALKWFEGIFPPREILRIVRLLSLPDYGQLQEQAERSAKLAASSRRSRLNLEHWKKHGCPHPVHGKVGVSKN